MKLIVPNEHFLQEIKILIKGKKEYLLDNK